MKGRCLLLPLGLETGQKAIWGPVCCQWSVSCMYTARWNGNSYHVTCENTYIKAFFAKIPLPNELHSQQGFRVTPLYWTKELSIITGGQEGGQNSKQGTKRFSSIFSLSLPLTHTHAHIHKECMANQCKKNVTLDGWSQIKRNKEKRGEETTAEKECC